MKKNLAQRDKVVFISLVDILLQLIFVLLIVVLFVFREYDTLLITSNNSKKILDEKEVCEVKLNECKRQNLQACIPISKTVAAKSVKFDVATSSTVVFREFSADYFHYLSSKEDSLRMTAAKLIPPGKVMNISDVEKTFAFVREPDCYHEISLWGSKSIDSLEYNSIYGRILPTFKRLSD